MENQTTAAQKIFFSYSRTDGQEHALKLANDLRSAGANVWIDQLDIELGKLWDLEVEKALNTSDCVLFIATEKSTTSNNVLNEVYYALDENKKVIPVVFHDCRIPFQLRRLQRIDFTADYAAAFQRLLKALGLRSEAGATALKENDKPASAPLSQEGEDAPKKPAPEPFVESLPARSAPSIRRVDGGKKKPPPVNSEPKNSAVKNESSTGFAEANGKAASRKKIFWGVGALAAAALIFILFKAFSGENQTTKNDANVLSKQYSNTESKDSMQRLTDTSSNTMPVNAAVKETSVEKRPASPTVKTATSTEEQFKIYFQSGIGNFNRQSYQAAIDDFRKAVAVKDDAEAFFNLGLCYGALRDYPTAISYYSKAVERAPKNVKYLHNRGVANRNNKDFKAALADFDQVVLLVPKNGTAYAYRGFAKQGLNDMTGACEDFATAGKLGDTVGQAAYNNNCGSDQTKRKITHYNTAKMNAAKNIQPTKKAAY